MEYGFRLPSALDNRPMRFDEFELRAPQTIYISATPRAYELERSGVVVEQVVRPTGLVDPELRCGRPPVRWTICSLKSVCGWSCMSGCW